MAVNHTAHFGHSEPDREAHRKFLGWLDEVRDVLRGECNDYATALNPDHNAARDLYDRGCAARTAAYELRGPLGD